MIFIWTILFWCTEQRLCMERGNFEFFLWMFTIVFQFFVYFLDIRSYTLFSNKQTFFSSLYKIYQPLIYYVHCITFQYITSDNSYLKTTQTDWRVKSFRAVVGELDDEMDARLDLSIIRAEPLSSVTHWKWK